MMNSCILQKLKELEGIKQQLDNITEQEKQEEFHFGTIQKQIQILEGQAQGIMQTSLVKQLKEQLKQLYQGNAMSQIMSISRQCTFIEKQNTLLSKEVNDLNDVKLEIQTNSIGQRFEIVQHKLLDIQDAIHIGQQNLNKDYSKQTQKYQELNDVYLNLKNQYQKKIEEFNQIPQNLLSQKIIKFKVNCPCPSKDCKKDQRVWQHSVCGTDTYVSNIGYIYCDQCKDDRHWQCKEYFIKQASFNCEKSQIKSEFRNIGTFLMSVAQSLQAMEQNLNDNDMVLFATALNTSVIKEWNI